MNTSTLAVEVVRHQAVGQNAARLPRLLGEEIAIDSPALPLAHNELADAR